VDRQSDRRREAKQVNRKEAILNQVRSIPAIPSTASQVLQVINNPDFEMDELIQLIEYDQVATANILRLANSAYFGRGVPVDSIREAVVRMGAQKIGQLTMVASVGPFATRPLRGYDLSPGELWRHSVAVAVASDLLAGELDLHAPSYVFTAGLLHDLGKIVLDVFVNADAEVIKSLVYQEHVTFEMAERQILGIDHCEVGCELLSVWNVPEHVFSAIRWHHSPDKAPETSMACDLIHLADHIAITSDIGAGLDGATYTVSSNAMKRLKADDATISTVKNQLQTKLKAIEELFALTR